MRQLETPEALVEWASAQRRQGLTIGLVPTMGYLHDGHLSLMRRLRPEVDRLVVSIYVNPLQFGDAEDLDKYPRDMPGDCAKCASVGVDAVFAPQRMYPPGFQSEVSVHRLAQRLEGQHRPGHFEGVCTVVARLFGLSRCDLACFGDKDFQQLAVIRRMVADLALPVRIVPGPLVRDSDGLALSSRNVRLDPGQRTRSLSLHRALFAMADAERAGERDAATLAALGARLLDCDRLDYLEVVDAESLEPIERTDRPARALVAAYYGGVRLIDNVALGPELLWI